MPAVQWQLVPDDMATILIRGNRAVATNASIKSLARLEMTPMHLGQVTMTFLKSNPLSLLPNVTHRFISSTAVALHKDDDGQSSTAMLHSLYHEQMKEIQNEREKIFGSDDSDESSKRPDLSYISSTKSSSQPPQPSIFTTTLSGNSSVPRFLPPGWNAEEAYSERESLFAFTEDEQHAWNNRGAGNSQTVAAQNRVLYESIRATPMNNYNDTNTEENNASPSSASLFSHLTPRGDGVSMVDVGHKASTRRVALARSVVVFPHEILSAFQISSSNSSSGRKSEIIGPKGPIFETAKIAGILGAKKTSDLIPLCHPLPLDRVNIQIELVNNQAIIECECSVTHTTGVEMEAIMGATIAALTIYDMVKAVSHRVEIGPTVLVSKSGGKSGFVRT